MRIRDLPPTERPRVRLIDRGPEALSEAELLSIVLGTPNALDEARGLLSDGLLALARKDRGKPRVQAFLELSRRLRSTEDWPTEKVNVHSLGRSLRAQYGHLEQEHLGVVLLDSHERILKRRILFVGTLTSALVSNREIARAAFEERAAGVILFHNHPSGSLEPSGEDVAFTSRTKTALGLLDIKLLDHVIVTLSGHSSFVERGLF